MIWIRQNQALRRNLTDDQRAMNAAALAELLGEQAKRDRAKAGRAAGGKATPEQEEDRLSTDVTPKRSDRANKSAVRAAKLARVSERKVREGRLRAGGAHR